MSRFTPKTAGQPQQSTDAVDTSSLYKETMINLFPYFYVHVIDTNTNITELVIGPKNIRLTKNLRIVAFFHPVGRSSQDDFDPSYELRKDLQPSLLAKGRSA